MNTEDKISIPTIEGVKKQWQALGDNYSQMDSCPQTFYYTLSNMLKLDTAQKILQIACGTGKLLPMAIDLKNPKAEYYATDVSPKMLSLLKERLQHHFDKYQSKLTLNEWMDKMKLKVMLVDGQDQLASQIPEQKDEDLRKFDRIIANLVLMLTPNPQRMLKNLFNHSKSGCLFGLTIWGNKQDNNVHTIFPQLMKEYGFPAATNTRSNFHLYKKVEKLASQAGWQMILNWEQKGIFPHLNAQQIRPYGNIVANRMNHLSPDQQKQLEDGFVKRVNDILTKKNPLEFAVEIYIFKKN